MPLEKLFGNYISIITQLLVLTSEGVLLAAGYWLWEYPHSVMPLLRVIIVAHLLTLEEGVFSDSRWG